MKISRVSDLEARQLLLRGHAQREARQRESLLTKKPPKIQDKQLTLRQRRILLLENDEKAKSSSFGRNEDPADANALATETLELTRMLKEQARNTKDIVGEDNKLLAEMDVSMDNNIENVREATKNIEEILQIGGSVQARHTLDVILSPFLAYLNEGTNIQSRE